MGGFIWRKMVVVCALALVANIAAAEEKGQPSAAATPAVGPGHYSMAVAGYCGAKHRAVRAGFSAIGPESREAARLLAEAQELAGQEAWQEATAKAREARQVFEDAIKAAQERLDAAWKERLVAALAADAAERTPPSAGQAEGGGDLAGRAPVNAEDRKRAYGEAGLAAQLAASGRTVQAAESLRKASCRLKPEERVKKIDVIRVTTTADLLDEKQDVQPVREPFTGVVDPVPPMTDLVVGDGWGAAMSRASPYFDLAQRRAIAYSAATMRQVYESIQVQAWFQRRATLHFNKKFIPRVPELQPLRIPPPPRMTVISMPQAGNQGPKVVTHPAPDAGSLMRGRTK